MIIDEQAMETVTDHLELSQVVALVAQLAWEQFRARFNRTLGLESDDLNQGAYSPSPLP